MKQFLGALSLVVRDYDEAILLSEQALKINPQHYKANLMLGRLLGMHGDPNGAVPYLQSAIRLEPQLPDGHKFLANVYSELGKNDDARKERDEAEGLKSNGPQ